MKKIVCFCIFLFLIFIQASSFGKYIFEESFTIANLNIDRSPPEIEVIKIQNNNIGYEAYANKTHEIRVRVSTKKKDVKVNNFKPENIEIFVANQKNTTAKMSLQQIQTQDENLVYEIILTGIEGNGKLTLKLKEGIVIDFSENKTKEKIVDTGILIDNIAPSATFSENKIEEGKVKAVVSANEGIRNAEGWNLSDNKQVLSKEFTSNVAYTFQITDFAQNSTDIDITIKSATNINLIYASHNSEVGWSYGYGNYDIAGKEAVKQFDLSKTEALAFRVDGNIDKDFLQFNSYVYTYWGEGKRSTCLNSGMLYSHGYNPTLTTYKTMSSNDLVTINGNKYIQFGGAGINRIGITDTEGKNPIPRDVCDKYLFGISGIKAKLKDESYYSIVYQIYVLGVGWIQPKSDGEEAVYSHDKPMSAIRMALIPKTEKNYILETWKRDVGTHNGIFN